MEMNLDTLAWLQSWYSSRCDGTWEHSHGVKIDTLDNPGRLVTVDVGGSLLGKTRSEERSDEDWISCKVANNLFAGAGGPGNLVEVLSVLRSWLTEP
jgi:hypothetical protein